jgi:predicted butyrate kinase (DUF1464 family)
VISPTKNAAGQAFLSTVLVIGGVMLVVATTVAIIAATFIDSGYGLQASNRAESVATAGVNDAFLRLVRASLFSSGGYTVTVPEGGATVSVTQSSPSASEATVLSAATVGGRTRRISAVFSISTSTGQVISVLWKDVQ